MSILTNVKDRDRRTHIAGHMVLISLTNDLNPSRKTELTHECHFGADCIDTIGTYECSCRKGYTGDGMMCKNINECNTDNPTHNCNIEATCYDEIGYFACICNDGYHGDGFGENGCIDVDECSTGVHTCLTSETEFQNKIVKLRCCDHNFTTKRNLIF